MQADLNHPMRADLSQTMHALERLMKMFVIERYLYLVLTAASFVILLIFAYQLVKTGSASAELLVTVFGGSGIFAATALRVTMFFNRAFSLVEGVIHGAPSK